MRSHALHQAQPHACSPHASLYRMTLGLAATVALTGAVSLIAHPATAQIVPDDTLGTERSVLRSGVQVRGGRGDRIDGGALRGSSLFHSFEQFNVRNGQRVYFSNPTGVDLIFSRVTGTDASNILGTLGVAGTADLYLLNPNGILFGEHARLDIRGAFTASTADAIAFPGGREFSAVNPQAVPLLSINVPVGLQFNQNATGQIRNFGQLQVGDDLTLAAHFLNLHGSLTAGGDITLTGDRVQIRDTATQPVVVSAGGNLEIQGDRALNLFTLNHPASGLYAAGNMALRSSRQIGTDAHYYSGGNFSITTLNGQPGASASQDDPIVVSRGDVLFGDYVGASLHILAGGQVNMGDVTITDAAPVNASINPNNPTFAQFATVPLSNGRSLTIDGSLRRTLDVRAGIDWTAVPGGFPGAQTGGLLPSPTLFPNATGSGITINSINSPSFVTAAGRQINSQVLLTNQYFPDPDLTGDRIRVLGANGNGESISAFGGSVILDSRGSIRIATGIDTSSFSGAGGLIDLFSDLGGIDTTGGELTAGSASTDGGNIFLQADQDIVTQTIRSYISDNAAGNGGRISLISRRGGINVSGFIESRSAVSTGTIPAVTGNGGIIRLQAQDDIQITAPTTNLTAVGSFVGRGSIGNGGAIRIESEQGLVDILGGVQSSAALSGNGGPVTIRAAGDIVVTEPSTDPRGVAVGSYVSAGGTGDGGTVQLISRTGGINTTTGLISSATENGSGGNIQLIAADDILTGNVESFSNGSGAGGTIRVQTDGNLLLSGHAILSQTGGAGDAGRIVIDANSVFLSNGAALSSSTFGTGDAGDITVQVDDQLSLTGSSQIRGTIEQGAGSATTRASDITIRARSLQLFDGSQVLSSLFRELRDTTVPGSLPLVAGAQGIAGDIRVNATDAVVVSGVNTNGFSSALLSLAERGTEGNAGDVVVRTGTLRINDGGAIASSALGLTGDGGNVTIEATQVNVLNGGRILAISCGATPGCASGRAGRVFIDARDRILLSGQDPNFSDRVQRINRYVAAQQTSGGQGRFDTVTDVFGGDINASSAISTSTAGFDIAGNIRLRSDTIRLADVALVAADTFGAAAAGTIVLDAQNLFLTGGAEVLTRTAGSGPAGNIVVRPLNPEQPSSVFIQGVAPALRFADGNFGGFSSGLFSSTEDDATGSSGIISVQTDELRVLDGGVISARSRTSGSGGDIVVTVGTLDILNGGQILAAAFDSGPAGTVIINAEGRVRITGQDDNFSTRREAVTALYREFYEANPDLLEGRTVEEAATEDAGETIDPVSAVSGLQTQSLDPSGTGAGSILVSAGEFLAADNAEISTSTAGLGNAGNFILRSDGAAVLDNARIFTTVEGSQARVRAGDVRIRAASLFLQNGAQIQTLIRPIGTRNATGTAGNVLIQTQGDIRLDGINELGKPSRISSEIVTGATGIGGNVTVQSATGSLILTDGGSISTTVTGAGVAGNVSVNVANDITIAGYLPTPDNTVLRLSEITSQLGDGVGSSAVGSGGDIILHGRSLILDNFGRIATSTFGNGSAGDITVDISDRVEMTRSSAIRALVEQGGIGDAGNFGLNARSLLIADGSQIQSGVFRSELGIPGGSGQAGDINITTTDSIVITGFSVDANGQPLFSSGVLANLEEGAQGGAGDINLTTRDLVLANSGFISVDGVGSNSNSGNVNNLTGNITITADTLLLNPGTITARTASGQNANIILNVSDQIRMQGFLPPGIDDTACSLTCSSITATAFNNGTGGNIIINTPFILADYFDNSDVVANAFAGDGGRVTVNGSALRFNQSQGRSISSDLDASSTLGVDGATEVTTEEQFEADLPVDRIDPATLVSQQCSADAIADERFGSFSVTGRGGLPTNPSEVLDSDDVLTDWVTADPEGSTVAHQNGQTPAPSTDAPIVEAQGWTVDEQGAVILTAQVPGSSHPLVLSSSSCYAP